MRPFVYALVLAIFAIGAACCGLALLVMFAPEGNRQEVTVEANDSNGSAQQPTATAQFNPTAIPTGVPTEVFVNVIVCGYRPSFLTEVGLSSPDYGVLRYAGSVITGPAIVQYDGASITAVYPRKTHTLNAQATVWEYQGDTQCLESQFQWFPGKNITRIN